MMRMVGLLLVLLTVTARISADPELLLAKLEHNYKRSLRGEVIGALSKAMLYMNSKYYELNLDALTGLRIAEGKYALHSYHRFILYTPRVILPLLVNTSPNAESWSF